MKWFQRLRRLRLTWRSHGSRHWRKQLTKPRALPWLIMWSRDCCLHLSTDRKRMRQHRKIQLPNNGRPQRGPAATQRAPSGKRRRWKLHRLRANWRLCPRSRRPVKSATSILKRASPLPWLLTAMRRKLLRRLKFLKVPRLLQRELPRMLPVILLSQLRSRQLRKTCHRSNTDHRCVPPRQWRMLLLLIGHSLRQKSLPAIFLLTRFLRNQFRLHQRRKLYLNLRWFMTLPAWKPQQLQPLRKPELTTITLHRPCIE